MGSGIMGGATTTRAAASGRRAVAGVGPTVVLALACFSVGACSVPRALNPAEIYREVSGANDAARPTPPGLDRPFPSLATVPPRPDRPTPEARAAITAALAEDRSRSRDPLVLRTAPGGGGAPAGTGLAGGPPPRPSLSAAPRIPWTEAPPAGARGGGAPSPAATPPPLPSPGTPTPRPPAARPAPEVPAAPPPPPAPELLGAPPPPPSPDLLAPLPPARR